MKIHKTGFHVWYFGIKTWHRTLTGAKRRANHIRQWTLEDDQIQIKEIETGDRIPGKRREGKPGSPPSYRAFSLVISRASVPEGLTAGRGPSSACSNQGRALLPLIYPKAFASSRKD